MHTLFTLEDRYGHDYFLYDWHTPDHISPHKLHGFYHPGSALHNAQKEYHLTPREKDIIKNICGR